MAKIVFFCIPAQGHTNPTLGVVRELVSRGHAVWYYSYEPLRERIEAAGARFVACDRYDSQLKLTPRDGAKVGKNLAFSTRLLVDTTLALDDMVCRDMEVLKPDCIVADSMAVWGKAAALKLDIPFVSSTTTFAFNRHSAAIMKQRPVELLTMLLSMPRINRDVARLRKKGYPVKSVLDLIQNDNDTHTIVYTSSQFQPCADTFSDRYAFVGPSVRPATREINKTGSRLIYVSMGTVVNDQLPLYQSCVTAFAGSEYQVIMSLGEMVSPSQLGQLPGNIAVYPYVDQIAVLQKADVFLSHCGMNSVNESLYHGVPLVMLPQTPEQGGVARRVSQLGAGLLLEKTDPASILSAVENVLQQSSFRDNAGAIAAGFRRSPGARGAADKIEQVCQLGEK